MPSARVPAEEEPFEKVRIRQLNSICPKKGLVLVSATPVFGRLSGRFFEAEKWDVELGYKNRRLKTRVSRMTDFVDDPEGPITVGEALVSLETELFMNETQPTYQEWAVEDDALDREEFWRAATAEARLRKLFGEELDAFFKGTWG